MTATLRIAIAHSTQPWRREVLNFVAAHVADVSLTTLRDTRSLADESIDALLVDALSPLLDAELVRRAEIRGIPLIGITGGTDDRDARDRFERFGIHEVLDGSVPVAELVRRIEASVRALSGPVVDSRLLTNAADLGHRANGDTVGVLVAIGGPSGAGRTEVTAVLAAGLARSAPTIIVDTSEASPHVARRLHLAVHPHLLTLLDARRGNGGQPGESDPVGASLARPAPGSLAQALPFDVIAGLASTDDWSALRPSELAALVDDIRRRWRVVVVTTSPVIEDLPDCGRYAVSRRLLRDADRVVGVCTPSPHGILKFVDWLVEAHSVRPDRAIDVVVNKAPRWPWKRDQVLDQLRETVGPYVRSITFTPLDRRIASAEWDGRLHRTRGWSRALGELQRSILETRPVRTMPPGVLR